MRKGRAVGPKTLMSQAIPTPKLDVRRPSPFPPVPASKDHIHPRLPIPNQNPVSHPPEPQDPMSRHEVLLAAVSFPRLDWHRLHAGKAVEIADRVRFAGEGWVPAEAGEDVGGGPQFCFPYRCG